MSRITGIYYPWLFNALFNFDVESIMRSTKTTNLRFSYQGRQYSLKIINVNYTKSGFINKLKVGHAFYWLVMQKGTWYFIGDMPLCKQLKYSILKKVTKFLGLSHTNEPVQLAEQTSLKAGILISAVLNTLAVNGDSHNDSKDQANWTI